LSLIFTLAAEMPVAIEFSLDFANIKCFDLGQTVSNRAKANFFSYWQFVSSGYNAMRSRLVMIDILGHHIDSAIPNSFQLD
jgi:hypothetical protein